MSEIDEIPAAAMAYAQNRLMLTAVRALIESHPVPDTFLESWAHLMSLMYRDHTQEYADRPQMAADAMAAFRVLQPVWQSYFPNSPAAMTKPYFD